MQYNINVQLWCQKVKLVANSEFSAALKIHVEVMWIIILCRCRWVPPLASQRSVCVCWWSGDSSFLTPSCSLVGEQQHGLRRGLCVFLGGIGTGFMPPSCALVRWVLVFLNSVLLTGVACCTRMLISTTTIQHSVNI